MKTGALVLASVLDAQLKMREALALIEQASHALRCNPVLADGIDARSLAVVRTKIEEADMWTARAVA